MHWEFRCISWAILWQTYRSPRFLHGLEVPWAKQKMRKPMVSENDPKKRWSTNDGYIKHLRGGCSTFPPLLPYENTPPENCSSKTRAVMARLSESFWYLAGRDRDQVVDGCLRFYSPSGGVSHWKKWSKSPTQQWYVFLSECFFNPYRHGVIAGELSKI